MFWDISGDVLQWVRASRGLSQKQVAAAIGRERHAVGRWENGEGLPSREQEKTLFEVAQCPRVLFAELVCKKLTRYTGRAAVLLPEGEIRGLPTTPLAEAQALLAEHYGQLPADLRQELFLRIETVQQYQYLAQRESFALQREVKAILKMAGKAKDPDDD